MKKQKEITLLIFLVFLLFAINYSFLNQLTENFLSNSKTVIVDRVIDGDTVETNGTSIRLLGVNTPERGEEYYLEAKEFLEELVLNKTVRLEFGKEEKDRYGRLLAYLFINGEDASLKLVEQGFGNFYFPSGKDARYNEFKSSWMKCIESNENLCAKSKNRCSECIELKNLDIKNQEIIFYNSCNFSCNLSNWNIKDEGRKNFVFPKFILSSNSEVKVVVGEGIKDKKNLFWKGEDYVWTSVGDTLFLRDSYGKLVIFSNY